jgi:hypothetical protein
MKILNFNWEAFDPKGGLRYAFGVAIVIAASLVIEFPWFACGTSALLVWLVNVPGPRTARLKGMAIHALANERTIAEIIGVVFAGFTVSMREGLSRRFNKQSA